MSILRRLSLGLSGILFFVLLLVTAVSVGTAIVVTHPGKIKQLVAASGVYNDVVPSALKQAGVIHTSYGNISSDSPIIKKSAEAALPPRFVRQSTEAAIDNTYEWLGGKLTSPNFKIDLSGAKSTFAAKVAAAAQQRMNSLPACSRLQSQQILASGHYDALNSTCLPYGVDPSTVAQQLQSSISKGQDFLPKTAISASDVRLNGKPVFDNQLKRAPTVYQWIKTSQLILIVLTVLTGAGLFFLSITWITGLRRVGIILVLAGILVMVLAWVFNRSISDRVITHLNFSNIILQQDIRNIATDLVQQVDKNYWYAGVLYVGLGLAAIGFSEASRRLSPAPARAKNAPVKRAPKDQRQLDLIAASKTKQPRKNPAGD